MVVSFKEDNSNTQSKQLKVKNRVITVMHILQKVPRLLARTSRLSPCVTRSFYIYSPEPLHALLGKQPTWKTADQAVEAIQSGKQNTYTDSCPETMSTQSSYFLLLLKKVADRLHWGFCHGWLACIQYSYDVCSIIFIVVHTMCILCVKFILWYLPDLFDCMSRWHYNFLLEMIRFISRFLYTSFPRKWIVYWFNMTILFYFCFFVKISIIDINEVGCPWVNLEQDRRKLTDQVQVLSISHYFFHPIQRHK